MLQIHREGGDGGGLSAGTPTPVPDHATAWTEQSLSRARQRMGAMRDDRDIRDAYEALAGAYDRLGDAKPANAYLERPATLSLLPDVRDALVLDAGCGAGHLASELSERGARTIGMDVSRSMVNYAGERVAEGEFVRADFGHGLPFASATFDGIASSLAFHYVEDWAPLFDELRRVLKPGGWVVCSVQHPHADFEEYDGTENYHEVEAVSATWHSFGDAIEVPMYRRPLAAMISPGLDAGFTLEAVHEPTPTADYREADPEGYAYESTRPNFLCLRFSRGA